MLGKISSRLAKNWIPYTASLSRTERQSFIDTLKNLPGADIKSFLDTFSLFERVKPAFSGCDSGFEIAAQRKRVPRNSTMM